MDVYHAALFLRQEVLALRTPPRLASATGLISATPDVPNLLYHFLAWLMYGDVSSTSTSTENAMTCRLMFIVVMSVAQDIIFQATRGRVKQAKHICLSMAVRHLT